MNTYAFDLSAGTCFLTTTTYDEDRDFLDSRSVSFHATDIRITETGIDYMGGADTEDAKIVIRSRSLTFAPITITPAMLAVSEVYVNASPPESLRQLSAAIRVRLTPAITE